MQDMRTAIATLMLHHAGALRHRRQPDPARGWAQAQSGIRTAQAFWAGRHVEVGRAATITIEGELVVIAGPDVQVAVDARRHLRRWEDVDDGTHSSVR
jgi:hypothetical protein